MECEVCGGGVGLMGSLGNLEHYQCRNCGLWTHNQKGVDGE